MGLGPRLDLRQSQQLVMTPQLQQAIRLLTLNNLEVEAFIADEVERNPLLEIQPASDASEGGEESQADAIAGDATPAALSDGEGAAAAGESADLSEATVDQLIAAGRGEEDAPLDADFNADVYHHDSVTDHMGGDSFAGSDRDISYDSHAHIKGSNGGTDFGDSSTWEAGLAVPESLHDHLMAQAGVALSGVAYLIATHIIDMIDDSGYIVGDLKDLAARLGASSSDVSAVLATIQSFDPVGVGARSLSECLAIQAREADRYDPAMEKLLNHLDSLARGDMARLRRVCRVDQEDLLDMIRELRGYDPKPGLKFGGERAQHVEPDVFVIRRAHGWSVELNSATLPRVLVSRQYYAELSHGLMDKDHKAYLSECLASANWLVKALDQRARTIVKVTSAIVVWQEAFFNHGVSHLKPLTLRQIAEDVEMHESTVSRVTSNKFLACERGLFELKYFFTSAIQSADGGDAVSAHSVKDRIKALIGAEEATAILSDDKLVELLREEGFDIARRTVAKYREALGLGSSVQRRRQKALAGA